MSTRIVSQKDKHVVTRADFLSALYHDAPTDLQLELRCIHPISHQVRTFWTPIGNENQFQQSIQQALKVNREVYGLYFAPCLRSEQKGTAASAALVPALWIDIDYDDDADKREQGLLRLQSFKPVPSAIIDSGGGWHCYWFLDEPYPLKSNEDSDHIEAILQGLFKALDGDAGYVKSVASIMRLPDSTNTKPERGGAMVSIHCMDANRRYPLRGFEWLKVEPKASINLPAISLNGHQSLPPRTEDYLATGASDGSRNNELFAAACQLRDAGYSQSEAENQLVARYLSDTTSGENSNGREREARKTIASAYSQSARQAIQSPRQITQNKVGQLVQAFQPELQRETPDIQQIIEAVEVRETVSGIDWFTLYIPMGAFQPAYNVGSYPFVDNIAELVGWLEVIEKWLHNIAQHLFRNVHYKLGLIGFEVSGYTYASEIDRNGIPDVRGQGYLWSKEGILEFYPANWFNHQNE